MIERLPGVPRELAQLPPVPQGRPALADLVVLVVAEGASGKGATLDEALQAAGKPKAYRVFVAGPEVTVDEAGEPVGEVRLVHQVKAKARGRKQEVVPA
jgi:hypothetical protein